LCALEGVRAAKPLAQQETRYLTFAVLFESQVVAVDPVPFPVTATAMNLPFKALLRESVDFVALETFLQDFGMVAVTLFTCLVQEYHW
jgi:hypothetical protein